MLGEWRSGSITNIEDLAGYILKMRQGFKRGSKGKPSSPIHDETYETGQQYSMKGSMVDL